jgi:hypothetical protein
VRRSTSGESDGDADGESDGDANGEGIPVGDTVAVGDDSSDGITLTDGDGEADGDASSDAVGRADGSGSSTQMDSTCGSGTDAAAAEEGGFCVMAREMNSAPATAPRACWETLIRERTSGESSQAATGEHRSRSE